MATKVTARQQLRAGSTHLTESNRAFFKQLLIYTRLRSFFKDPAEVSRSLLEIQADLADAQADGVSAEVYFGAAPASTSTALLHAIPSSRRATMRLCAFSALACLLVMLLPTMMLPGLPLDVGRLPLATGATVAFVLGLGLFFSRLAFTPHPRTFAAGVFGATLLAGLGLGGALPLLLWTRTPWRLVISDTTASWVILGLLALLVILSPAFLRLTGWPGLLLVGEYVVYAGVGLALRQPLAAAWLKQDWHLVWVMVAALIGLTLVTALGVLIASSRTHRTRRPQR
ncbi:hypothetical protein [Lacticaseibacillus absianus]|uniref:hypothetical protein n=1 Tax=Lacticaseibacillus absianus TaxID=2729623 RepID=UPI0015C6FBE1|nr:hypothetical protein [Lacticaseibacillus absianus]